MKTILIVDDRPTNREFLATLLGYGGHRLLEAADGAEALRLVQAEKPDLVISDILMPTMDGFDFAKSVRADPAVSGTKIVFYTATYRVEEASLLAKACGVTTVIAKPADPQEVLRIVNEQLGIAPPAASSIKAPVETGTGELVQFGAELTDYVNDLRGVKSQLDGLVERGLALEQERERLREISSLFTEKLAKLRTTSSRLYGLVELGMDLAAVTDPQQMLRMFTAAARRTLGASAAVSILLRPVEDLVQNLATEGLEPAPAKAMGAMDIRDGLVGEMLAARHVMRWAAAPGETLRGLPAGHPPAQSALGIPIASQHGRFGLTFVTGKIGEPQFSGDDERVAQALAAMLVVIYEKFELFNTLQQHAAKLQLEILERERSQEALAESEQRFQQLAESVREVFYLTNLDGTKILYASPAYERIWGNKLADLYATPDSWTNAIHPDDRPHTLDAFKKGVVVGQFDLEYRIVQPDGSILWIHDRAFPVRDASGNLYRIAGVAEDITERKLTNDRLRLKGAALNAAANAIVITDRKGIIQWVNPSFSALTGYSADEAIGKNPRILSSGKQGPEFYRQMYDTILGGSVWQGELINRYKDGRLATEEMTITPVRNASGEIEHFIAIKHDITARKEDDQKIRRLNRVYAVLSGINTTIVRVKDRQELLDTACRIAVELGEFAMAWIGTLDPATQDVTPIAWAGEVTDTLITVKSSARSDSPRGNGAVGQAIRERHLVFNNDVAAHGLGGPRLKEIQRLGFNSQITLPLYENQAVVGVLTMYAREPGFFVEEELRLLTELAGDISFALENINRQRKLEKLSRIRRISSEINSAIVHIREPKALLRETCRIAAEHGKFEMIWIGTVDTEKQEIRPVEWTGFSAEAAHKVSWKSISEARGTLGEAVQTRKPAVRNDIEKQLPSGGMRGEAVSRGCHSTICLPLAVEGSVVALVSLFAPGTDFFDEDELALLGEVAADISFALHSIAQQEKVDYLSYYDTITGLPNRRLFIDRAGQQTRSRADEPMATALILLNLERFRNINESLGRQGGDELLRLVAQRLERAFRGKDHLARIGADNFGVVVRGIRDSQTVARIVQDQVLGCLVEPFRVNGSEVRVVAKAGIALHPADGQDADTLFKNAEAALKKAKAIGDSYMFYSADMNARAAQSLSLENRLRKAVEEKQFVLHYQPKISLADGRICGLEALIRWQEPGGGLVSPGVFIPLLEETGLIRPVGRWALAQALAHHREWTARGCPAPRIAVNVSAIQLQQKDFVDTVIGVLQEAGANSEALELEVTESLMMNDIQDSIRKLSMLKDLGITLAMDDFGTGYSSLSYLAKLPINTLKIDRAFITGMAGSPQDMSIVTTIIALAHSLKLKVVAEGVETAEQAKQLKLLKCDEAQGYLYSKPVGFEAISVLLGKREAAAA